MPYTVPRSRPRRQPPDQRIGGRQDAADEQPDAKSLDHEPQ